MEHAKPTLYSRYYIIKKEKKKKKKENGKGEKISKGMVCVFVYTHTQL